jgi:hypothetical protein
MLAGVAEAVIVLVSMVAWSAVNQSEGLSTPSGPSSSAAASGVAASGGTRLADDQGRLPASGPDQGGCPPGVPSAVRCPSTPECFDKLVVTSGSATARRLDCGGRHIWEVFALADLPQEVAESNYRVVAGNSQVRQVCSPATLTLIVGLGAVGWTLEVLPPTTTALKKGDRTYRCLASRGGVAITGPQLGQSPY